MLNEIRVPLSDFAAQGVDLANVRKFELRFGGAGMPATGSIQLSDVRFQEAAGGPTVYTDKLADVPPTAPPARHAGAPAAAAPARGRRATAAATGGDDDRRDATAATAATACTAATTIASAKVTSGKLTLTGRASACAARRR